jgi:glycerol-3-phosphate dehydrogenase
MPHHDHRTTLWSRLPEPWDILVIGGGITGAGILREAARLGLRVLLVEQCDFGWGTSSRSSKMVHGGLRYLKDGRVGLTWASVRERKRLLAEGAGLIDPLGFLIATYKGDHPGRWTYGAGLTVYDLLALQWGHRRFRAEDFQLLAPHIRHEGLEGGYRYGDAQTDDARLVLRVIQEAVADGGVAMNYVRAEELLREGEQVVGARLRDMAGERTAEVRARIVVNATGGWVDRLRGQIGAPACIRPLRGSHLIFPSWRLPCAQAITFLHPLDRRPVFIFPWEGITLVGTTDLDHDRPLDDEPAISPEEVAYLMAAVESQFPVLGLQLEDILATFAGVRPVIRSGRVCDPSKESRDHVVWEEHGLVTVTGGKLTTFRRIAYDVLRVARRHWPELQPLDAKRPVLDTVTPDLPGAKALDDVARRRLVGRYGAAAPALVAAARPGELEAIPGTDYLWAELRWAARAEAVVHLDDLLLRRVRLGLLLPQGGAALLPQIRSICQGELGWDDLQWEEEAAGYRALWQRCYSLPDPAAVPDWRALLAAAAAREPPPPSRKRVWLKRSALLGALFGTGAGVAFVMRRFRRRRRRRSPRV